MFKPWDIMLSPDMVLRAIARVLVQGRNTNNHSRGCVTFSHKVTTAQRAKAPQLAGGRLVVAELFLPPRPMEVLTQNTGRGDKRSSMGFAARLAMTMAYRQVDTINFIANGTAGATSFITGSFVQYGIYRRLAACWQ